MTKDEALEKARAKQAADAAKRRAKQERETQREIAKLEKFFRGEEPRQIQYIGREILRFHEGTRSEPLKPLLDTRADIIKRASRRAEGSTPNAA